MVVRSRVRFCEAFIAPHGVGRNRQPAASLGRVVLDRAAAPTPNPASGGGGVERCIPGDGLVGPRVEAGDPQH